MEKEELDLLEIVFTLALGECAYNDINNIQKLENKIKTIGNLCKKQKEVINNAIEYIKNNVYEEDNGCGDYWWEIADKDELLKILQDKEVSE